MGVIIARADSGGSNGLKACARDSAVYRISRTPVISNPSNDGGVGVGCGYGERIRGRPVCEKSRL